MASLCLSLAGMALALAIADLASVSPRAWMRTWEEGRHVGNADRWDTAYERLKLARRLNPLNADYSADLGRLMEWKSWRYFPKSIQSSEARAQAGQYYEEALYKRPGWGFAWAQYAQNRLLSGNLDGMFMAALEKAMILAPWEPGAQRKVAWMGMATWEELPAELRDRAEESIGRTVALESDLEEIVRLSVQYGWLDRLRPMMQTTRQLAALNRVLERSGQR